MTSQPGQWIHIPEKRPVWRLVPGILHDTVEWGLTEFVPSGSWCVEVEKVGTDQDVGCSFRSIEYLIFSHQGSVWSVRKHDVRSLSDLEALARQVQS